MNKIYGMLNFNIPPASLKVKNHKIDLSDVEVYKTLESALNHATGALSKRDIRFINFYEKIIPALNKIKNLERKLLALAGKPIPKHIQLYSIKDIRLILALQEKLFYNNCQTELGIETYKSGTDIRYTIEPSSLEPQIVRKSKRRILKNEALKNLSLKELPELKELPYNAWFDTSAGNPNYESSDSRFKHLENKILTITGLFNKRDLNKQSQYITGYENMDSQQVLELRFKILDKLKNLYYRGNPEIKGNFTSLEIKRMKELLIQSRALGALLDANGINIRDLEGVIYSKNSEYEVGSFIEGLGLVTDKMEVNQKPVIITFNNFGNGFHFYMYDLNQLKKREEFISTLPKDINDTEQIKYLDRSARMLKYFDNDALICSIGAWITDSHDIYAKDITIDSSVADSLKNLSDNNKYSYYISDFNNYKKAAFPSAARIIGVRLLKALQEHNPDYPAYLIAYNKFHSPASMYMRIGFEPISKPKEYMLDVMYKNHGEYTEKEPLGMYIPSINAINEKLNALEKIYFANAESLKSAKNK